MDQAKGLKNTDKKHEQRSDEKEQDKSGVVSLSDEKLEQVAGGSDDMYALAAAMTAPE